MNVADKLAALRAFYERSFEEPKSVAEVTTSGSYAKKVRALARLGTRHDPEIDSLCRQVDHLRCAFKIMDDVIDEDDVRDGAPAFWAVHGVSSTIEEAAWHTKQARRASIELRIPHLFEQRLREVIEGATLEVEMEDPCYVVLDRRATWWRVVQKESAFRIYLAEALGCPPTVCEAARIDGIAAQILDDALSAIHGKDSRTDNSDIRLGRLTFMVAFEVSPQAAEAEGRRLKGLVKTILEKRGD